MTDRDFVSRPLSRRTLLAAGSTAAGLAAFGLAPKTLSKAYAGEELNLTIIQPHAIAGSCAASSPVFPRRSTKRPGSTA